METRAHHLLVGSFVIVVVLGLLGFVIWLAKIDIDREFARYTIYFDGSVSGLSTAAHMGQSLLRTRGAMPYLRGTGARVFSRRPPCIHVRPAAH